MPAKVSSSVSVQTAVFASWWRPGLRRLGRLLAWALLGLGLLLALAWALLHAVIVPRIGEYRDALQTVATRAVGLPVRIGQVQAFSTGWVPSLELRQIELLDPQGRTALRLPRVVVAISVQSVLRLGLEQLVIDAPELAIRRDASGQWSVAGLPLRRQGARDSVAADWLFAQREVLVRGGAVHWHDERGAGTGRPSAPLVLTEVDLIVRNSARQHALRLDATPPAGWGERFVVSGRFRRGLLSQHPGRWQDWSGQLYAFWPQLQLQSWRAHLPLPVDLQAGQGRLRLWSDIQRGQWVGGTADVALQDLRAVLRQDLQPLTLARLSGRLQARREAAGWSLATQQLGFALPGARPWPGGDLRLQLQAADSGVLAGGRLEGERLDLQALQSLALRVPLSAQAQQALQAWQLRGQVRQLALRWQGQWPSLSHYSLQLQGQDLDILPVQVGAAPLGRGLGLQGARLDLQLDEREGRASLSLPAGGALVLGGVLEEPRVPLRTLQAQARWQRQEDGRWQVPQWSARLDNADLSGQLQGTWSPTDTGPGRLSLEGRLARADAARIHRYLPLQIGEQARHYVRDAIVKGTASEVQVRIEGDLAQRPFAEGEGQFRFAGQVRDLQMAYVPERLLPAGSLPWPALQAVRGELVFDRLRMQLSGASGLIGEGLQVSQLRAGIADMAHQPVVEVQAELQGRAMPALRLVRQSPLGAMLGGTLDQAEVSGALSHRLRLSIPVLQPQQARVQGSVQLQDNDVQLMPQIPRIERARGQVLYTEQGFALQAVQAQALGGPVALQGGWRLDAPGQLRSSLSIRAEGMATAEGLRRADLLPALGPAWQRLQGQAPYTAEIGWHAGQPELDIRSSLQGLALAWPAPLGKTADEVVPLHIRSQVLPEVQRERLVITLGERASALYLRALLNAEPGQTVPRVLQGSLTLGAGARLAPPLPPQGVSALVFMDRLSIDEWQALRVDAQSSMAAMRPASPASTASTASPASASVSGPARPDPVAPDSTLQSHLPNRIGLQVQRLQFEGRQLQAVTAGIEREGRRWRASVDAQELAGTFDYEEASEAAGERLQARLARLNLPESAAQDVTRLLAQAPRDLPALDIVVESLQLRGLALGRAEIEAVHAGRAGPRAGLAPEWQIRRLSLEVPEAHWQASGRWLAGTGDGTGQRRTELDFALELRDAGALLGRLGMDGVLRGGQGEIKGRLAWLGSPLSLHLPSLQGRLQLAVGRGQFLKADPGVAKLLGVLSLQALPRRLLLDFRDVFAEGFAFDNAQGDAQVREGLLSTDNLQIRGINAVVQMAGSADLARETQDLRVLILPELDTGTASLVAGLTVNPVVGLTTYLAQLFLRQPLRQAGTQLLAIEGPWREPRITRLPLPPAGGRP